MPFVEKTNVKLFYSIKGSGEPIILIHGAFDSHRWWNQIINMLSQKYTIVAIDVRGHGDSTKLDKPSSVERFSEDLHCVLEELDLNRSVLVGHSMGGMITLQYTLDHPKNVKAQVLIATTPYVRKISIRRLFPYYLSKLKLVSFEKRHENRLRKTFHPSTPQDMVESAVKEEMKHVKDYMKIIKSIEHFDVTSQLKRIKQPSLIIVGEKESVLPGRSQLLYAKIPNARFVVIEGYDHNLIIDVPKRIVEEITEFLNEIGY